MNVIAFDPWVNDTVFDVDGTEKVASVEELYHRSNYLSLHIPATAETKGSVGYELLTTMPKGATLINTARKEVIDEAGLARAMEERADLKYATDVAPETAAGLAEKFGKRFFATSKKMGAETAEANINAGLAAASQIVDFFETGNTKFQVNK
jgi:D-3-phosphoglycerate dehydrogenase